MPFSWCYYDSFRWFFLFACWLHVRHFCAFFCFFWRIIYKFYRFFALFLSRLGRGFSDVPPLALALRSSTASAHILYLCGVWSSCCQAFLGECYRKIQEVDCEHGANWMIRGMGLELHHHNDACVIVMTQNFGWLVFVCVCVASSW